jgi:NAD+ kinase
VNKIQKALHKLDCSFKTILRTSRLSFRPDDFIITVGGDGTFLRTAHHVITQRILGINSDPQHSVGALCSVDANNFEKKMRRILAGKEKTQPLTRMTIMVNGKKLPIEPINDVLFANESPAATSRYTISVQGKCEEQKSSGVWIAAPCGSTAGILAAGGKRQNYSDVRLQFLIREPFHGTASPYKLKKGFIKKNQHITLINQMPKACLFLDGPARVVKLGYGDRVVVKVAKNKLKRIV